MPSGGARSMGAGGQGNVVGRQRPVGTFNLELDLQYWCHPSVADQLEGLLPSYHSGPSSANSARALHPAWYSFDSGGRSYGKVPASMMVNLPLCPPLRSAVAMASPPTPPRR
jgi:hypothetical protein